MDKLNLDYGNIKFPASKKYYSKNENKNTIRINVFVYEIGSVYPLHLSNKKSENFMHLFLITDDNKSRYAYIKG